MEEQKTPGKRQRKQKAWVQEIPAAPEEKPAVNETPAEQETTSDALPDKMTSLAKIQFDEGAKVTFTKPEDPIDSTILDEADSTLEQVLDAQPLPPPVSEWELFVTSLPKHVASALLHSGLYTFKELQDAVEADLRVPKGPFSDDALINLRAAVEARGYSFATGQPANLEKENLGGDTAPLAALRALIKYKPPKTNRAV